ncbi:4614_t:CDS:2, partial [Scutellospora calospora]
RYFHSSVLIDNKLYFSGGYITPDPNTILTTDFFYLDVSKSFKTTDSVSMLWNDLSNTNGPKKAEATAYPSRSFIDVNKFDVSKQQWIETNSAGNTPSDRTNIL